MTGLMDAGAAAEIVAIEQLLVGFLRAADEGSPEDVAACFSEDGEWLMGATVLRGGAQIVAAIADMRSRGIAGPGTGARHLGSNFAIQVSADRATAHSCFSFIGRGESGPVLRAVGVYLDTLVRGSGGWRILRREIGA